MHTSYFLFVMVITMFCYAVIKGRPSKLRQSNPEFCPEKVSSGWVCQQAFLKIKKKKSQPHASCSEYSLMEFVSLASSPSPSSNTRAMQQRAYWGQLTN